MARSDKTRHRVTGVISSMAAVLLAAGMTLLAAGPAGAVPAGTNLLTDGDFESGAVTVHSDFVVGSGPEDTWLSQPLRWNNVADGLGKDGAGDNYARHFQNTVRLFQVICPSPVTDPAPGDFRLGFDFVYQSGFTGISQSAVHVLGLSAGDDPVRVQLYPGDGFPPGDVLYSESLVPDSRSYVSDWTHRDIEFTKPGAYDAMGVVFTFGAFGTNTSGLRGVDNVTLAAVPEPGTMLLLGSGVAGLALARRKRSGR